MEFNRTYPIRSSSRAGYFDLLSFLSPIAGTRRSDVHTVYERVDCGQKKVLSEGQFSV